MGAVVRKIVANPRQYLSRAFLVPRIAKLPWRARMNATYNAPFVLRRALRPRKVAVFPMPMNAILLAESYFAWKVLNACGAVLCDGSAADSDLAIAWYPTTQYDLDPSLVQRFSARHAVVNSRCTDIRKSTVGDHFSAVFGYRLEIDPLTHRGLLLRKSEKNGPHDGKIMEGPLEKIEAGYVYQRVVDCETSNGMGEWRIVIVGGKVTLAYRNYRPIHDRFRPHAEFSELCSIEGSFSAEEREQIEQFTHGMGLDFGTLDVMRDNGDGRIYICDCNNTPTGPSETLPLRDRLKVVRDTAAAFEAAYF